MGSIPESGSSPGEGNGNPFQYFCQRNLRDRGACSPRGHKRVRHNLAIKQQHICNTYYQAFPSSLLHTHTQLKGEQKQISVPACFTSVSLLTNNCTGCLPDTIIGILETSLNQSYINSCSHGAYFLMCCSQALSHVQLFVTLWTVAFQAPLSQQEYWRGLPSPPPGDFSNPGIEPRSPTLQVNSLLPEPQGSPTF